MTAPQGLSRNLTETGDRDFAVYMRRSFAKAMGYTGDSLGKPIVGILNNYSELNNCHRGLKEVSEAVKRGVYQAGGLPLEFPTISLGEIFLSPTSMMYRNLMSMDVEAMLTAQPLDAVVLLGGCDKTLPAMLMGAASANIPAIVVAAGPMLTGSFQGERLGACTDCRRFWATYRRGEIDRRRHRPGRRSVGADCGHLRRHGHGQHHGLPDRGARDDVARRRGRAGSACRALAPRRTSGHCSGGNCLCEANAGSDHDADGLRKCPARAACHRRIDQRHHSPDRHRRQAGHPLAPGSARSPGQRDARAGGPQAIGPSTTWRTSTGPAVCPWCCNS